MSQSGKTGQKNPGAGIAGNPETLIVLEQRPLWVPSQELQSFARFQRFVLNNTPFGAGVPSGGEQAHWTALVALVGITMGA